MLEKHPQKADMENVASPKQAKMDSNRFLMLKPPATKSTNPPGY
jgi:hypothetical protein